MSEHGTILTVVALYLLAMVAIGWWARVKDQTAEEYFLAGKSLPYWVVAFSMNATGESAWLLLGLSGLAYVVGVHALWVVLGETLGIALSWYFVGARLNQAAHHYKSVTLSDLLVSRFSDSNRVLRVTGATMILSMVIAYVAAQLLATGKAFEAFLGWPYATGVVVGGLVTIAYTSVGGFRAVAYTDTVQAILMLFALLVVPLVGLVAVGGPHEFMTKLVAADPQLLNLWGPSPTVTVTIIAVASALAIGLPFAGAPQLLVRFMSARGPRDIRKASYISICVILLFDLGAVATGLVGRTLFPELADPEAVMPEMSRALFPPLLTGVLVVAVLSAIMSTVSSLLSLASSAVVRDLYQQCFRPNAAPSTIARLGLWVTVIIGVLGCWIALKRPGPIFALVLFASGGLGVAFGPAIISMLWKKGVTRAGIIAGMIGGFATTVYWTFALKERFHGLYEVIPGFAVGFLLIFAVSAWSRRRQETP